MKNILLLTLSIFSALLMPLEIVFAQTSTTSAATVSPSINEQIDQSLQERIASRVAQLNLVQKRAVIGTVTDVNDTQITLNDIHSNIRFVDVDELTQFNSPNSTSTFGISDIKKGDTLGVLGLYNKQSSRILARFVDELTIPFRADGAIETLDSTNFLIGMVDNNNKRYSIEVEDITKTFSFTTDNGLVKSGFSKLSVGQRIFIEGYYDLKDKSKVIASRITIFPSLPINPEISLAPSALNTTEITPSTGSGHKLTPIVK